MMDRNTASTETSSSASEYVKHRRRRPVQRQGHAAALVVLLSLVAGSQAGSLWKRGGGVEGHRHATGNGMPITKIIHQSWKTAKLPEGFGPWQSSWKKHNPGWEYKLWTDEDNRRLVTDHYPWFLDTYDSLPKPVMKADASRYLYMHHIGGVYADLDFECLRPLDDLLAGHTAVVARMTDEDWDQAIPNAWLASTKGHPFWLFCVQQVIKNAGACRATNTDRWDWLEATTGPVMLWGAIQTYKAANDNTTRGLTILPRGAIYPIDWRTTVWGPKDGPGDEYSVCNPPHPLFDEDACKARYPEAFALTYWSHTWGTRT